MSERFDVVIAGGAVMGSAIAYFLLANPDFQGTVLVVERDPGYANCATTRSWGGVRQQFSTPENIRMSQFGAAFVKQAAETLGVGDERPDLAFREQGYLFLASPEGRPILEANVALQRELGADISLLEPAGLAERFPWLNLEGLAAGAFGERNEGWIDPAALLHAFRRKAISLGARYRGDEVVAVARNQGRVTGVTLKSGAAIDCGLLVNAAGPQAGRLAALAGVTLPVGPRKRSSFVFDCRAPLPPMPLTIDCSGVAVRPEGRQYIAIVSPPESEDGESDDLEPDYRVFEETIWPIIATRIPAFEAIKLSGAWGGHYDYNAFDQNAILGRHPDLAGFLLCNGFSGHGIQQAPAAGRAISELIVSGNYTSIDLSRLGFERLVKNMRIKELNVV